jgi:hypothetical protein
MYQDHLRKTFERILLGVKPPAINPFTKFGKDGKKLRINFDAAPEVWILRIVRGHRIEPTKLRAITPTLDAFVAYAGAVWYRESWRTRLGRCQRECGKYFLAPKRRGGPTPHTCIECKVDGVLYAFGGNAESNAHATEDSWRRVKQFLRENLGSGPVSPPDRY